MGTGAVLLATGEPGVGKTALLETVVQDAAASDATVLQAATAAEGVRVDG